MSPKICIVILTCNRSERIRYYINKFSFVYEKCDVDLIIYDSSDDDSTKIVVEQCINYGNKKLKYKFYSGKYDGISLDQKVIDAYKETFNDYDYIWLCRDGLIINYEEIQNKIEKIFSQKYELIVVDSFFRTKEKMKMTIVYNDCRKLLKEQCIRMVTLGTVILSSTLAKKLVNNYEVNNKNYTLWQAIVPFYYFVDHDVNAIAFYDNVFLYHPIQIRSSFWNKAGLALWQWGKRWYTVINLLPEIYENEKEFLYPITMFDFNPFGIVQLFIMKSNGGLKFREVMNSKEYLKKTTITPFWKIVIISILPIPKKFIRELIEENKYPKISTKLKEIKNKFSLSLLSKKNMKKVLVAIKQRILYPSSKSFHDNVKHISMQISFANYQLNNFREEVKKENEKANTCTNQLFWISINKQGETLEETKKRFFRELPSKDEFTILVQAVLKKMIKDFSKICDDNGLRYWAWGGTLLGIVRHGGFIPWDDDVDFAMPRNDFRKLQEILQSSKYPYKLIYYYNIGWKGNTVAKIPKLFSSLNNIPLYIDVFPFDWIDISCRGDAEIEYKETRLKLEKEVQQCMDEYYMNNAESQPIPRWEENLLIPIFQKYSDFYVDEKEYLRWGIEMHHADIGFMPREWIFNIKICKFYNIDIKIPNMPEKCLEMLYGDYYTLPDDAYKSYHTNFFEFKKSKDLIKKYVYENDLLN